MATSGTPPHTLEACAGDVLETLAAAGVSEGHALVVCGHSFGGKVALALTQARLQLGLPPPKATWILDSVPGRPMELTPEQQRREQSVSFVLAATERAAAQGTYASRSALVEFLAGEEGLSRPLAQWVAQSVRNVEGGGVELAYDMEVLRSMYEAYRNTPMWEVLEGGRADFGVVVAGRNRHAWGSENLARLERCGERVNVVTLEGAGHNVHVDDLSGLLDALEPSFA